MNRKALFVVLSLIFIEWLDFSLYLYLAKSIFATHFFPPSDYSLVLSFALFAAAFLARPLGGWFFGRSADSRGRRTPLIVSAALMGGATIGIALLPNYSAIGISATWGLLLLRIGQGLALGGELNNSAMFLIEHFSHKRMITGSWVAACGAGGMFLGGATAALLQSTSIDWLWRPIFVIVGFLALWISRLRKKLQESPEFTPDNTKITQIIKEEWQGIINIAVLGAFVGVTVYICNAYWVSYAIDKGFWSPAMCSWAGSISQLCSALLALPIARLIPQDKFTLLLKSSMLTAVIAAPILFVFTAHASIPGVILGLSLYVLTNALLCSTLFYFLYLQLPAKYRCRGVSTVWALATSLGAFSLPIVEQANVNHMPWLAPFWVSIVALFSYSFLNKNKSRSSASPTALKLRDY